MTSSRLPGKHLLEAAGMPMIGHLVRRLKSLTCIDEIVIAMTDKSADDPLENYINSLGVLSFRGNEDDVMGRVLAAAIASNADVICEVTGDCPIIDPILVKQVIKTFLLNKTDYVNNGRGGLPDGMGCQVFSTNALSSSERLTQDPLDREHVTLHIRKNPTIFPSIYIEALDPYKWPELAVTLDEERDYVFLKKIIEVFESERPLFNCLELFDLLNQRPEWLEINSNVVRKGVS